jgi:chromosome segregation ATPase
VRLKKEAKQTADVADAARRDADVRCEMLRMELAELRGQLAARDAELVERRADCRAMKERAETLTASATELRSQIDATQAALATARTAHAAELADVHARYEGLSRQLLRETEHQRQAHSSAHQRLTQQLDDARVRLAALEGLREQLFTELAAERDVHQRAEAEASALATVVAEQHHALQALAGPSAASPAPPTGRPRAARRRSAR